ncbi:MAG: hypothetical protein ACI9KE_006490, partial [Polyangiales bacterium]
MNHHAPDPLPGSEQQIVLRNLVGLHGDLTRGETYDLRRRRQLRGAARHGHATHMMRAHQLKPTSASAAAIERRQL